LPACRFRDRLGKLSFTIRAQFPLLRERRKNA
jgi:hypothetical protein